MGEIFWHYLDPLFVDNLGYFLDLMVPILVVVVMELVTVLVCCQATTEKQIVISSKVANLW